MRSLSYIYCVSALLLAVGCSPKSRPSQSNQVTPNEMKTKQASHCDTQKSELKNSIQFIRAQTMYTQQKHENSMQKLFTQLQKEIKSQVNKTQTLATVILQKKAQVSANEEDLTTLTPEKRKVFSDIKNTFIESLMSVAPKSLDASMVCNNITKDASEVKDSKVNAVTDLEFACIMNSEEKRKVEDLYLLSYQLIGLQTAKPEISVKIMRSFPSGAKIDGKRLLVQVISKGKLVVESDTMFSVNLETKPMLKVIVESDEQNVLWKSKSQTYQTDIESLASFIENAQLSSECQTAITNQTTEQL